MSIDFRKNGPQPYRDWGGEKVAQFVGRCLVCKTRVFDDGDQNDPRGAAGMRAAWHVGPEQCASLKRGHLVCFGCYQDRHRQAIWLALHSETPEAENVR